MRSLHICSLVMALVLSTPALAALLPPQFISSVVAIGIPQQVIEQGKPPRTEWIALGTGFFFGKLVADDPDITKRKYEIYLVTAKHVIHEHVIAGRVVQIRINPKDTSTKFEQFDIPSRATPYQYSWFYHPDDKIDLAAVQVNFNTLLERGFDASFFHDDQHTAATKKLVDIGVSAGDGVFVLGFPMQMTGNERHYVIVRQGIIARIAELLEARSSTFLLDSFVFPGNSGGPVILKPEITAITGTKSNNSSLLIGLVLSYRSYNDIAYSKQTQRPRVVFEENSGLSEVLPVDKINDAIEAWQKVRVPLFPTLPNPAIPLLIPTPR